ncbi:uncharacterized protein LOC134856259, partial [Symsagittifera roscoffensis]|uniref:uncharacterized protein LOC134856259 n=1 Tax=Symsagittifera roscoffensis TaxID=84072 RepID=UPI00307B7BDC
MGLGKKKWEDKRKEIKKCVKDVCSIDAPVVFVENEPEDYDLEINERTGCSQLPNGDVQPHNVSEAILKQLDKNEDNLGHIALKEVYAGGDKTQDAKQTMQVVATDKNTPLSFEEGYIKQLLGDVCDDSEIEAKLQECVETDQIDKRDVATIDQFCRNLVEKWGIRTFKELQKLTMQFLIDLTGCELEDRARAKFAELFELDNSYSVPAACQELCKGFNVLVNDFTASPVFENFQDNKLLLQSLKKENFAKTLFTGEIYNSTDEFIKSYVVGMMKNDNFQMEKYGNIIAAIRPHPQEDKPGQQFLLCNWETRLKQLDLPDLQQLKLSVPFRTAIEQLPEKCDIDDVPSLQTFVDFCGLFGTHFVRKAYCGGLVQIGGYMKQIDNDTSNQIRDDLYKLTEHWNSKISAAADTKRLAVFNFDIHISESERRNDEQSSSGQKSKLSAKKSDEMHQWRFNLPKDMVILKNNLEISPINKLIKLAGFENQAQAMDDALAVILGDSQK